MFKINNWKQKIYKDDLITVLINGFLASVLGGILAGLLDFVLGRILSLNISIGLVLLFYFVTGRVKKSYYNYHILYPVLSLFFMLFGLVFSEFSYIFCFYPSIETFKILLTFNFYLDVIINPFKNIISFILASDFKGLLVSIFNLVIYIYVFVLCYRVVKGRN